ncbi:MAG: hypothetical protein ACOC0N_02985 [Chroococcales cyanobacterium]
MVNTIPVVEHPTVVHEGHRSVPWWEKIIALIAIANLFLALFNLTYTPLRDFYLIEFPPIVSHYDSIKGIEPHPFTQNYLETVDFLESQLSKAGEFTPQIDQQLADLRQQSREMIEDNPFVVAEKLRTFARIQRLMRQHMKIDSPKEAFVQFWTKEHLLNAGIETELSFFDVALRPQISSNYFREVDDFGVYIDDFWRIDVFFVLFFALEFLTRTFIISVRNTDINWLDAMLRRWYDIPLFIPFWRWMRIVPVSIRIHKSKLLNLERALAQVTYEPAAYLSDRISQFILVRFINETQESIVSGEAARSLFEKKPYITVNEINEIEVITDRLLELTIYKVLPKVQPDLEALLHHSLRSAFKESGFYSTLMRVPGMKQLPNELIESLSTQLARASVDVIASSYSDVEGRKLFDRLSHDFSRALSVELQNKETLAEIEALLTDWLEEVKLNYVTKSVKRDPTETMEELEKLTHSAENYPQ